MLEEMGFLVSAIRFPTVPRGKARLRASVSAGHSRATLSSAAAAMAAAIAATR